MPQRDPGIESLEGTELFWDRGLPADGVRNGCRVHRAPLSHKEPLSRSAKHWMQDVSDASMFGTMGLLHTALPDTG